MSPRFPLLTASLFSLVAAACADDPAAVPPDRVGSRAPVTGGIDPGPRPEIITPEACIVADAGALQFGTTKHDEVRDVVVTPAGTILVAGFEEGTDALGSTLGTRGLVLEYARDLGNVERRANLDTDGSDAFEAIAIAPDTGRMWLAARTTGDLAGLRTRGSVDVVVGELAATGGFRPFARGFDSVPEHVRGLAVGRDGALAIVGDERRTNADGIASINPWLATFTAADTSVTQRAFASRQRAERESFHAVDVAADRIAVGGTTLDGAEAGMFVEAYDHDGARRWRRQLSALGADAVTAVKILPDGDVVLAGSTRERLGEAQLGGSDVVIGRLDGATGEPAWLAQLGSAHDDRAVDLALGRDGRIHVAGTVVADGDLDAFVLALDADGQVVLEEGWGSGGHDVPTAIAVDPCGAIVVAGHTSGDLGGTSTGGRDGFVLVTRAAE